MADASLVKPLRSRRALSLILSLFPLFLLSASAQRIVTFSNHCPFTVWPANIPSSTSSPLSSGGFELPPGASLSLSLPPNWSGRFWGRTGCNFSLDGTGPCETGPCGNFLQCPPAVGGTPPASLAEITLGSGSGIDFYDISLVDGFNLPLSFGPQNAPVNGFSCGTPSCAADINSMCPGDLAVVGMSGAVVACASLCFKTGLPQYCCAGAYNTPQTCSINSQAAAFEQVCPSVYTWAYDDPSSTFTCQPGYNYELVFCP